MRPWLIAIAGLLLVPSHALAQAEAPYQRSGGGAEFDAPEPLALSAAAFTIAPGTVRSGTPITVQLRVNGVPKKVAVRIALVSGKKAVGGIRLGKVPTGKVVTRRWRPMVKPGRYVARLQLERGRLASRQGTSVPVVVQPKPKPPPPPPAAIPVGDGIFPVRGSYSFGSDGARFGAGRPGHIHQGQDITGAEGTPVVSPVSGSVYWRAVQPSGAGHYLVIRGDDGTDYVFMHLVADSELVDKGDTVAAGQQIAQLGNTGDSSGPHLHFEMWPDGWYADGSQPIDPLPTLRAWAAR